YRPYQTILFEITYLILKYITELAYFVIFSVSFGGPTLYKNPFYISPNQEICALEKEKKTAGKYTKKVKAKMRRKMHELLNPIEPNEFADLWND
ncbi:unnamed protein product, partial [Musa hybrid cultivar]